MLPEKHFSNQLDKEVESLEDWRKLNANLGCWGGESEQKMTICIEIY